MNGKDLIDIIIQSGYKVKKGFNGYSSKVQVVPHEGDNHMAILADIVGTRVRYWGAEWREEDIRWIITNFSVESFGKNDRIFIGDWPADVPAPDGDESEDY